MSIIFTSPDFGRTYVFISVVKRPYIYRVDISFKLESLKYYIYGSINAACRHGRPDEDTPSMSWTNSDDRP